MWGTAFGGSHAKQYSSFAYPPSAASPQKDVIENAVSNTENDYISSTNNNELQHSMVDFKANNVPDPLMGLASYGMHSGGSGRKMPEGN